MKLSCKGLTGAAAILAAALGLNLLGPHRAYAAPGGITVPSESDLGVTILSPDPHTPLTGLKPVEISAFYQGSPTNQIVSVELYLDGHKAATKTLDVPETRGVVSFLVDASQLSAGSHRVVIRATAADEEVKSAKGSFQFGAGENAVPLADQSGSLPDLSPALTPGPVAGSGLAPKLRLIDPSENGKVQGTVTIKVQATDSSGKAPYVSLFIDKTFKTLRNFAPYEFEWDTTTYPNGYHTIEVSGYNDSPHIGHAKALRLYVNNPGGETQIRHDLLDGAQTGKAAPKKSLGRPLPLRRPDLLMSDTTGAQKAPARMASVMPPHIQSTREIVRHLLRGANSLHLSAFDSMGELSDPYVGETPSVTAASETAAPQLTSAKRLGTAASRSYKPLNGSAALPDMDTSMAALTKTTTTAARRISGKIARLQRVASVRLPTSDLSSPYLLAPRVTALPVQTSRKLALYRSEMQMTRAVIKPVMKTHPLRVHLPASLGSLLRTVGQTSVLFNHTTVKMDRPLTERSNILFGPLRQIFEQGGGSLTWQARTGTVHAKSATKDITLTIGQDRATINAKEVTLDGKPYLMMGRTMVPLSFVTAALDADVQYDAATGHLLITSRQ